MNKIFWDKIKVKLRGYIYNANKYNDDKSCLIQQGKIRLGYKMDLDNPQTLNEKINWYKLNYKNDLMIDCVDKWKVREYVKNKGLEYILLKDYGIYNNIDEIDLNKLPDQFVAKVTGDSGGVVVCKDKNLFYQQAKDKFIFLNNDYSIEKKEWPYHFVNNKIIIEELIRTDDGHSPNDYKFFCFNGEPKFLFVASERDINVKFDFYDLEWQHLSVVQGHLNSSKEQKKPEKFEEMLDICRILSKDFPHVRVDLYYEKGNIYFGELTFYHFSGLTTFYPKKYDKIFGEYFDISSIKK